MRIEYCDDALTIIDKVNVELAKRGLEFVYDGKQHDGYEILALRVKRVETESSS